jgi:hypothetical protein
VSGSVTLDAPSAAGTTILTLPTQSGTVVVTSGAQTIEFADGSASTPSITNSGDLNTGMFFPAADTIAFAEGGTEQMRLTDTGLLQFNSGYGSVATAYGCRAWVNFNGTGTVAIRASGNVSSITDSGVGLYGVNFTTAMPDVSYSYSHAYSNEVNGQHTVGFLNSMSASQLSVAHYNAANSAATSDKSFVQIAVFR